MSLVVKSLKILMATQPISNVIPSVQVPQTNCGILQQTGSIVSTTGQAPGEQPNMLTHLARAQLVFSMTLTSDLTVGTEISPGSANSQKFPVMLYEESFTSANLWSSLATTPYFYFGQTTYWNADVVLHFWAIKPPQSVGRLRIIYIPPSEASYTADVAQREITEEWDLSATNVFEFRIPSYNLRSYRNCVANYAPLNGATSTYQTPECDYKVGRIRVFVTHVYQPGSIFPQNCNIMAFQSFQKPQFAVVTGPALPIGRSALTNINSLT